MAYKRKKLGSSKRKKTTTAKKWTLTKVFSALDWPSKKVVRARKRTVGRWRKTRHRGGRLGIDLKR